ncbi:M15 family metallopeptidase [Stenotrophomonas rhizophila]|uniref:M15 family metallopeptidase n=1 Tax=Stenotrophomonas TaxID=40323 RepID=UPI001317E43D|nr:M15 family metallopeptidase [Stenotrophomonas sp. 364]QHB71596.1 M15 family peptidase [Stenotrophomonas sp. 364]
MVVIIGGAVLLVLVTAAVGWVLMFPESFERIQAALGRVFGRMGNAAGRAGRRVSQRTDRLQGGVREELGAAQGALRRHWMVLAAAGFLLLVPPAVILLTRQNVVLDEFRGDDLSESGSMVAQLLRGERLTPPAPPPPEVFTTEEIRKTRPEIVTADRKWGQIDPDLQQRVLAIYEVMRRQYGYEMVLVEGYRSPERQAELMSGGKATRAGAWQSCHQYGLGVDSAPIRDGKLQWDMGDPWTRRGYFLYGELAEQAGLEWGGNWRSIKDYVHVEMAQQCRAARAAKKAELAKG